MRIAFDGAGDLTGYLAGGSGGEKPEGVKPDSGLRDSQGASPPAARGLARGIPPMQHSFKKFQVGISL